MKNGKLQRCWTQPQRKKSYCDISSILHFYALKKKIPNGSKKETNNRKHTNQEESRIAHLSYLWREGFLSVCENNVIFQT